MFSYPNHYNIFSILPHPIHERGNTTICLIMRDLDRSEKARIDPDVDKQARQWAQKLELEYGVTEKHVQKVKLTSLFMLEAYVLLRVLVGF